MELLNNVLDQIELGELTTYKQISVIPIISKTAPGIDYRTLPEVLGGEDVRISEISSSGSVGELSLINDSEEFLLLLDGEELMGAKQNRVMNSSIMAAPRSKMKIPVSCTEQGRWSYQSRNFEDSGVVMPLRSRYNKKRSVDDELESSGTYRSNQRQVWQDISQMSSDSDTNSTTGAMKDVYKNWSSSLEAYAGAFKPVQGQTGMVVFVNGDVAGLEVFSKESALQSLAPKLIKSYAMDVLLEEASATGTPTRESAEAFIRALRTADSESYKSIGEGWDHRFSGNSVTGSALTCNEEVVHAVFYNEDAAIKLNRTCRV
jgi:hypothetical protein